MSAGQFHIAQFNGVTVTVDRMRSVAPSETHQGADPLERRWWTAADQLKPEVYSAMSLHRIEHMYERLG